MYYYVENGGKLGPLSKNKLRGQILKDTLVWTDGMTNWIKASKHPDLKDLFMNETPPPIPKLETKDDNDISVGFSNSVLWLLAIVIEVFLDFYDYTDSWIYGITVSLTIIVSYYALKSVKLLLRNNLKITIANKIMNTLIVTTIIIGIAQRVFIRYELSSKSSDSLGKIEFVLALLLFGALIVNWVYYFKLGRILSGIENGVASRLSKFAYATVISYFAIVVLLVLGEDSAIMLNTLISIIPLIYLISAFQLAKKEIGYEAV